MANELTAGQTRVGDLFDGDADTPSVQVALERSARGVSVTVPWRDRDSPYAEWFLHQLHGKRIDGTQDEPVIPRRLLFKDGQGHVLLIGCWPGRHQWNLLGAGSGTLWADIAIVGPHEPLEFDMPHGLETEISGLRRWLEMSSWDETRPYDNDRRCVAFSSKAEPPIELDSSKGITTTLQPSWHAKREDEDDRIVLSDIVLCRTHSPQPRPWDEHLRSHQSLRELLVLSSWRAERLSIRRAFREDDPLRTLDGSEHGPQWREAIVPEREHGERPSGRVSHLIRYAEIGKREGLLSWLALRDEFARALDPVITSIDLRGATANTLLAHTGPGLEALGYLLFTQRDHMSESDANGTPLRKRLDRILADVADLLPFDGEEWATETVRVYNGLKHANRTEPEPIDVLNAWQRSVLVVRTWVAHELGVPDEDLKNRLAEDPQSNPLVARD